MPNFSSVLKAEISRLAAKEVRLGTPTLKKASARHRRDIAELKRSVSKVIKQINFLFSYDESQPLKAKEGQQLRFSPKWLAKHRSKLDLSAQEYAKLVGVSALSIYGWEKGKSKPRKHHLPKLAALRALGKKEVRVKLELMKS